MPQEFIQVVTAMGLIGIPSIFSLTMWCVKECTKYSKQLIILMRAQKAQMRAQLLKDYSFYKNQGWISDVELKEWVNQYNAYHELVGENGVLDDRYKKLLELPNEKPE
ncbi:MAG: hypothetical protein KBT27_16290 [Prevotellaceae bacterium]|nr:hypothetical protein [Candidatus Faecinaster equi]